MTTFDLLVASCKRRGIQLPPDLDNFGYHDAPRFHGLWIGIFGMDLTAAQIEQVVDHAMEQIDPDCAATVSRFAGALLG